MTGMQIYDGYGQTETILVCGNFVGAEIRPGSMGRPSPGVPLSVVDTEGNESKPGVEGDIGILLDGAGNDKFFGLFEGYLSGDGKLDRRVKTLSGKRWYLTGDRATRDKDGYFWFVGRADDVINSSGYRIGKSLLDAHTHFGPNLELLLSQFSLGPFEVESTLKLHPAVIESAVVASPDPHRSEVVKAFIVLTSSYSSQTKSEREKEILVKELQEFCKENAAPYKYPRKIQFVDASELPKTISGKIKRNELKAAEWRGTSGKVKL